MFSFLDLLSLIDPGLILFGLVMILFGAVLPLVFLLKICPKIYRILLILLCLIEFLFIGILWIDLAGVQGTFYLQGAVAELSASLSTHRFLIVQAPLFLLPSSILILLAYKDRIQENHAKWYRVTLIAMILVSFVSTLSIACESLI
ncbi:MAG: hypothetical protein UU08_C0008G0033 [Candidatus Uhrbacteria bacterium GW2011_GWE2_40_58]|nr:MAG: hypothetical protein UT94_C0008G0034 [Candidatus Uhrbacteria bacterium GW2011_GWF2_40_263]KKR67827.1 MAG: hypothetical protein UU08_C0008G0033 [Candidatus Uhrbacteria bacterium GW2011_GWE2_40_58]OGL94532.1 MAG: hypothetical protein A2239_00600 [Candidatus Uhrbacteria bacterium RIFOXYA2_FULL_40_9]OGL96783.1 MAG: hypothetical protein A2332_04575 [Candidatus Uhrbacteria bacterium RIFOXYB2_FULL_41_18]HBK34500.1 hypothetical protein [Candidatus Uhrbacteria bacterium]